MKVTRILLIVLLGGLCALLPGALMHFHDYFDPDLREANFGHYDYHPASLLWSASNIALFISLLFSVFGKGKATRISMLIVPCTPLYVLYGNYIVEPRGLNTTHLNLLIILGVSIAIELLLVKHLKNIKETPT